MFISTQSLHGIDHNGFSSQTIPAFDSFLNPDLKKNNKFFSQPRMPSFFQFDDLTCDLPTTASATMPAVLSRDKYWIKDSIGINITLVFKGTSIGIVILVNTQP